MRITGPVIKVLVALLEAFIAGQEVYGLSLSRETGIKGGTLHPILDRLEDAGWVTARWEDVDPGEAKRPRRRYYTLSAHGAQAARQALLEYDVRVPAGLPQLGLGLA